MTNGRLPSPYLKAIVPAVGTVLAVGIQWIATGTFTHAELATALTGLLAATLTYLVPNGPAPVVVTAVPAVSPTEPYPPEEPEGTTYQAPTTGDDR